MALAFAVLRFGVDDILQKKEERKIPVILFLFLKFVLSQPNKV